jgi:hypothetical protein
MSAADSCCGAPGVIEADAGVPVLKIPRSSATAASVLPKIVVDRIYPFDQAVEALQYAATGRAKGKLVIEVRAGCRFHRPHITERPSAS